MSKLIRYIIVFSIFCSPLGSAVVALPTPIGNFSLFRVLLIVALVLDIINERGKITLRNSSNNSLSIKYFWLLLAYSLVTILWSRSITDWIRYNFFILIINLSLLLVTKYFKDMEAGYTCLKALNLGILVQAAIGLYEAVTGAFLFSNIDSSVYYRYRFGNFITPIAMQNNPNNFALMMYVGVSVALALFLCRKKGKLLYLSCAVVYCVLLFLTMSRAALLAVIVSIGFCFFIFGKKKLLAITILLSIVLLVPGVWGYITQNLVFDLGSGAELGRINLIRNGFSFTIDTVGFGVGAGQIQTWLENKALYPVGGLRVMHNWWIELLTTYGLLFFLGYIVFYGKLFIDFFANRKCHTITIKNLSVVVCSFLIGFVIACIGPSSVITFEYLWLFWAVIITLQGIVKQERNII